MQCTLSNVPVGSIRAVQQAIYDMIYESTIYELRVCWCKKGFSQKSKRGSFRDFKSAAAVPAACLLFAWRRARRLGLRLMELLAQAVNLQPERDNACQRCQSVLPRVRGAVFLSVECFRVFILSLRFREYNSFSCSLSCLLLLCLSPVLRNPRPWLSQWMLAPQLYSSLRVYTGAAGYHVHLRIIIAPALGKRLFLLRRTA